VDKLPKREVDVIHADGKTFILEGTVGKDYRISIPKIIRKGIAPDTKVRITIEKIDQISREK
jgi:hypothetical protein